MLMFRLFESRTTLDKLREKYASLMRHSFETALVDRKKSDRINEKARKILDEIKRMELQEKGRS